MSADQSTSKNITDTKPEKNPKRVAAGKNLLSIIRQQKRKKIFEQFSFCEQRRWGTSEVSNLCCYRRHCWRCRIIFHAHLYYFVRIKPADVKSKSRKTIKTNIQITSIIKLKKQRNQRIHHKLKTIRLMNWNERSIVFKRKTNPSKQLYKCKKMSLFKR